jgi:hypothetical protein
MYAANLRWPGWLLQTVATCVIAAAAHARAQEPSDSEPPASLLDGPAAAVEFEESFRDAENGNRWQPVPLDRCENITELTKDLWSKKDVLTDFKKNRSEEELGVIVIVKTELCSRGSRLCAVATASLEKKSTPLVGRFRVYAGWIKNNPDHARDEWGQWERDVIKEYNFIQGPGARLVVMVPTWDGKMYEWHSTATELNLNRTAFTARQGETPQLENFLRTAIDAAPATIPSPALSQN